MDNSQEVLIENESFKYRAFDYFYYLLSDKNDASLFSLYFLHFLEIIQLISYAFSQQHLKSWKIPFNKSIIFSTIISAFRLTSLLQLCSFLIFIFIFIIFFLFVFSLLLIMIIQIFYLKENNKIYNKLVRTIKIILPFLNIFLYIPILELFLLPLKCVNNKIFIRGDEIKCWSDKHYILLVFGIFGVGIFVFWIVCINFFIYYPFYNGKSTKKLNSYIDTILFIIKLLYELKFYLIKNEYVSIVILLILSLYLLIEEYSEPIYNINNNTLELFLNIRNFIIFWTFFILFIAKLCINSKVNGLIYLLILGYPIIIFCCIIFFNQKESNFSFTNSSFNNINSCISKTRFLIKIITNFIENHSNNLDYNDNSNIKNDILLKGLIQVHSENCLKEDCPLTKFINSKNNYNYQKQCLLNYISIFFNTAIKKFPSNQLIRLHHIQFNYDQKFNLNSLKANLEKVKKMKNNIKDEYLVYCMEREILKIKIKEDDDNESEKEFFVTEQNYKKLKNIIINSTKLFVEFWGIFTTNITNSLNTAKLHKLGDKLNIYLKEINYIWDNNLKNKKISIENENIAQLYSLFLKDILWNQKKSEEIKEKINIEHKNIDISNNNHNSNNNSNNHDTILESQEHIILLNSNEKGNFKIFQITNNLIYLIGYQKQEIINKPLEILIPNIFINANEKILGEFLKTSEDIKNKENDYLYINDNKSHFILIKNKMGYLVPFNAKYTLFDENDFSDNLLIKVSLESRDSKLSYPYYILSKPDFSIESISSSAIHLGIYMELLKKYIIKLNLLIRTNKDNYLNLFDKYTNYLDEPKKIIWVYPNLIYPNDCELKNKENDIQITDLIKNSNKKILYLQIIEMKFNKNEISGFVLKLTEINKKNKNQKLNIQKFLPSSKNEIIFDLLNLNYIRTVIVKKKSGMKNLREKNEENLNAKSDIKVKIIGKNKKKRKNDIIEESSNEDEEKLEVMITKDKLLELQTKDSTDIKIFINLLPFYGNDVSLIKHRPNKEKYPIGKPQEPLIKIDVNKVIKRIDLKLRENPELYKKIKNLQTEKNNENKNNSIIKNEYYSSYLNQNEINNKENDRINKDYISKNNNNSIYLMNLFNFKSLKIIKCVDYLIYIFINIIIIVEFIITYISLTNHKTRFFYLNDSYQILNDLTSLKYYILESILPNYFKDYILIPFLSENKEYYSQLKEYIEEYRQDLVYRYSNLSNPSLKFSKEYYNFISTINISILTLSNGNVKSEEEPFNSGVNRLITAIFYMSTSIDNNDINLKNKYIYELMSNLIQSYFLPFQYIAYIIFDDCKNTIKKYCFYNIIIFIISLVISILYIIIYWKIMAQLDQDREKPINLFLTIKKQIFENLKTSSENLSNKLLNKYFGNDENEEESQQQYKAKITSKDINVAKFKALNDYKSSINKNNSLLKYFNNKYYYNNIENYLNVFNYTQFSRIYLIGRINMVKQFFFNESLALFQNMKELNEFFFMESFYGDTEEFDKALKEISKSKSFLQKEYKNLFQKYVYHNYTDFILINAKEEEKIIYNIIMERMINNEIGFKYTSLELYNSFNFIILKYIIDNKRNESLENISELLNDDNWITIHINYFYFAKPWYKNIIDLINSYFFLY